MRIVRIIMLCTAATAVALAQDPSPSPAPSPEPLPSAALRVRLSDLTGALSNEGFKSRDRVWSGQVKPGQPQRLAVNLFRGNQYWFCAAVDPEIESPRVTVFGPDGQAIEATRHSEPGLAAAGVTAEATGHYFVEVETSSGPSTEFCFVYLFK
jgi:hypothetical protein